MKIYKYILKHDVNLLALPYKSQILSVKNQGNRVVLYALVDPEEKEMHQREFVVATTGGMRIDSGTHKFIGSVILRCTQGVSGYSTAHVFEKLPV